MCHQLWTWRSVCVCVLPNSPKLLLPDLVLIWSRLSLNIIIAVDTFILPFYRWKNWSTEILARPGFILTVRSQLSQPLFFVATLRWAGWVGKTREVLTFLWGEWVDFSIKVNEFKHQESFLAATCYKQSSSFLHVALAYIYQDYRVT